MQRPIKAVPVPEPRKTFVRVESPKVGQPVKFVSYSRQVIGIRTHWMDGTTHPCLAPEYPCPGCGEKLPRRWKGYLFGWSLTHPGSALLELPADTIRAYIQLRDAAQDLRGYTLTCTRVGPNANSRVAVAFQAGDPSKIGAQEEPDVIAILCKRWGLDSFDCEVARPRQEGGEE